MKTTTPHEWFANFESKTEKCAASLQEALSLIRGDDFWHHAVNLRSRLTESEKRELVEFLSLLQS